MFIFTFGWAFWYACAAGTRVESTHTVREPVVCGAWLKPSFTGPPGRGRSAAARCDRDGDRGGQARGREGTPAGWAWGTEYSDGAVHRGHGSSIARVVIDGRHTEEADGPSDV